MIFKHQLGSIFKYVLKRSLETDVRVRFAPSPTGKLHLGSLRTAFFNYLLAKSRGGKFILRVEDTDQQRIVDGAYQKYENLLDCFGLHRDEGPSEGGEFGPYLQSQRSEVYKKAADELVDRGFAYYCFCSRERLHMLRWNAVRRKEVFRYDNHCRRLSLEEVKSRLRNEEGYVIRFKLQTECVTFQDEVFGKVSRTVDEGDFVLLKSDGYPTYHLANVVDDHLMKISHVVRGMEWIPSTPKHINLYKAFGWSLPKYVHLPLITRNGTKKLSKRDKDAYVEYYVDEIGYLPIALLNFLLRNGSGIRNFDNTHLYTVEEMIENFDIKLIGKRNFMMDESSLDNYGQLAFAASDEATLLPLVFDYFQKNYTFFDKMNVMNREYIQKVLKFVRQRNEKFAHLLQFTNETFGYFFKFPSSPSRILENFAVDLALKVLRDLRKETVWNIECLKFIAYKNGIKDSELFLLLRLCLSDNKNGPPVKDLINFFGKEECFKRVDHVIKMLSKCVK